ncbi:MAG: hypothetical protein WBG92_11455 [Thiohalocapsa sp.]
MAEPSKRNTAVKEDAPAEDDGHRAASAIPDAEGQVDLFKNVRLPRAAETRAANPQRPGRPAMWEPQGKLAQAEVPARDGFKQRWIRAAQAGAADDENLYKAAQNGWVPRQADTIPEHFAVQRVSDRTFGNVVMAGDMILCERPLEQHEWFTRGVRHQQEAQMQAVRSNAYRDSGTRPGEQAGMHYEQISVARDRVDASVVVADD